MNISRTMLRKAVEEQIISEEQSQCLYEFLKDHPNQAPAFNLTNVLYYFGGLLAIAAMTVFMGLSWELYGQGAVLLLSLSYALLGLCLANKFKAKGLAIPAGICATFTICLTPLIIYALQNVLGLWPSSDLQYYEYHQYIQWNWYYMELGTLVVALILAWIYRYPFMIMPIAVTLWYLSMDLTSMLNDGVYSFELASIVSLYFGLGVLLIAFWVDIRSSNSKDYAFWLYIFGVLIFWSGLSLQDSPNELSRCIYLCINLLMIIIGVVLNRKVFVLFGALGCCWYLSHLAYQVFKYSYFFPLALTLIGIAIIYLGVLWQKNEIKWTNALRAYLPKSLRALLAARE